MDTEVVQDALARALPRHLQGSTGLMGLRRLTGGSSQSLWSFDAVTATGVLPLILRCAQQWSAQSQDGSVGMAREALLLQCAASAGIPVPEVHGVLDVDDGLGEGYLMNRIEGETRGKKLAWDAAYEALRPRLTAQCGAILARIHALPLARLPALRTGFGIEECQAWTDRYCALGETRPVFEWALRWLRANAAPAPRATSAPHTGSPPVLVHGDFRNGNLIVGPEGVRAVLDWELAHFGDPMEDLGWFCLQAWRFGAEDRPAGGFGSREALFEAYEAAGGQSVDPRRVHFWEVLGTFKWGVACLGMAQAFCDGSDSSLERAAVGRRVSETELDILQLLSPRA